MQNSRITKKTLYNKNTKEEVDISHVDYKDLSSFLSQRFGIKIYYFRHLPEDNSVVIDFGLYNWFVRLEE